MKITYDKEVDALYIYIKYPMKNGVVKKTIELNEDIIIDFNKKNRLVGIEVLNFKKSLIK
jgi:uncharacterized protein YuzE